MLTFGQQFGANSQSNTTTANSSRKDLPKAKIWLNIGFIAAGAEEDGSDRFVSLPMGLALDTMEPVSTNSNNDDYAAFQAARNDLQAQLMDVASKLEPGEDVVIGIEGGLAIQIRRVSEERAAPAVDGSNKFARKLNFISQNNAE